MHPIPRKICPWSTRWIRAKVNRVLPRECTSHSKHPLPTTQDYTWTSLDGQYWNHINYILCSQRWRSSTQSGKTRLGADFGSEHDPFITKFKLKLKKVGKTTRSFRYDLNQIRYDYIMKVTSRFKGLDLIECLKNNGGSGHCTGSSDQKHPQEKKCKKANWLSEEALQTDEKRREAKDKGEKERYTKLKAEFQRIARRYMKVFLSDPKKQRRTKEWERQRSLQEN